MGKEATEPRLVIGDLRGGRNGTEPPLSLPDTQCVEALNVDWWNASVCRKRSGASAASVAGPGAGASPFTGVISWLGRHVPAVDESQAEIWGADDAATPVIAVKRPSSSGFVAPAIQDPVTGAGWDLQGVSFKGKYFLAYKSGQPRLHVYDSVTNSIRRTGLATPGSVSVIDGSVGGVYPAVKQWFRVRGIYQTGGITTRRSEPGPSTTFTPAGSFNGVLITLPVGTGEGENAFEIEASLDGVTFYTTSTGSPLGIVFYNVFPSTYGSFPVSPATGTYTVQKSYRFLAVDNNRILGFGSFTATDPQSRIEYSGVAGSTNVGDEERVPLANYLDLDDADSGQPTGLIGPMFGAFYAFKYRQIWKLTPTGNAAQPYTIYPLSKVIGAIHQNAIDLGEDAAGNPVVYFMSARGPYRLGLNGLEYLGLPVEDLIQGPTLQINLSSATVVAHGIYHTQKRQWWLWYAAGGSDDATVKLMFDVRRSAWARHDGPSGHARCSVMFARGLVTLSRDMKPYIGQTGTIQRLWMCDDDSQTSDAGTVFAAFVLTKPYVLGGFGAYCTMAQGTLIAPAATGITLMQRLIRDFGQETQNATVNLTPVGSETRVMRLFDAGSMSSCWAIQLQLGELAPAASAWAIDVVTINYIKDQAVV